MSKNPSLQLSLLAMTCALAAAQGTLRAGSFSSDFNSGLPADSSTYSNAAVLSSGGYTNGGFCQLTADVGSTNGSFVITNDLDGGVPVVSFTASFKVLIGGGDRFGYGDGMSFNFAPDVPLGSDPLAEQGVGSGLRVGMRTTKDSTAPNPAISVSGMGVAVSGSPAYVNNLRANTFVDMVVQLNPDNTISILYDGVYLYSNVFLGWSPPPGSLFWIGARTGGSRENHWIDNLSIVTRTSPAPFINTFAPRGRQVTANSGIDVVLTDYTTAVNTNTIVLKLDGTTVSPTITRDGSGDTTVHFVPASAFAPSSQHAVSLTFQDNAATPQTQAFSWEFTVAEALPTGLVTIFSDGFEGHNLGYLDKNFAADPNYAPNGSSNPWFGPYPENHSVVGTTTVVVDGTNLVVTPHSGTNMITKAFNFPVIWVNLAYRAHGGQPIKGNCQLDWWFFDANERASGFKDYVSLYFYGNDTTAYSYPFNYDWVPGWDVSTGLFQENGFAWRDDEYQSLSIGGSGYSQGGGYYDAGKYQVRSEEMASGTTYGIDGWVNAIERTQGWHHNRVIMGPPHTNGTVMVYFYIDDMTTPVFSSLSTLAARGINLLEIDGGSGTTTQAFYDDINLALVRPPNVVATPGPGHSTTLSWTGEGFTLQAAPGVNGPWTDIAGATSPYTYDTTSSPMQFFRLRN